jgi:hypothetical protein
MNCRPKAMSRNTVAILLFVTVLMAGCAAQEKVVEVEVTVAPQVNIVEVTATPVPTNTPPVPTTVTVCADGCDFTTIQAVIDDPNVISGSTVQVNDAVHTESEITINKDIIIQGRGAENTIVQAHEIADEATDRVFFVREDAAVVIRGMTIRHGNPDLEPKVLGIRRCGGGIANIGTLTVEDVVIVDNIASGGGGVINRGDITFVNTTISNNVTNGIEEPGYQCATGGGIKNIVGTIRLINSTISGNSTVNMGGGIQAGCGSTTVLTNSTISGNTAGTNGGAVHLRGKLVLFHSTISDNSATYGADGVWLRGDMYATNSIIANNGEQDCIVGDRGRSMRGYGMMVLNLNNLIEYGDCPSRFLGDPLLGPLADNGGKTQTHALLARSSVIDEVECDLVTDQRGEPRQGDSCDLGAFEFQPGD